MGATTVTPTKCGDYTIVFVGKFPKKWQQEAYWMAYSDYPRCSVLLCRKIMKEGKMLGITLEPTKMFIVREHPITVIDSEELKELAKKNPEACEEGEL